jgi:hypothetical protein
MLRIRALDRAPFHLGAFASIAQYFSHINVIETSFDSPQTVTWRP